MTLDDWYELAAADADRRELPDLKPVLNGLRSAAATLRAATWNDDARGVETNGMAGPPASPAPASAPASSASAASASAASKSVASAASTPDATESSLPSPRASS